MTVVAFKKIKGVIHVAADTLACADYDVYSYVRKIKKYNDDWGVGLCGDVSIGEIFLEYCKYNMPGMDAEAETTVKSDLFDVVNFSSLFMSDVKTNPVFSTDENNKPSFVFLMIYRGKIYTYDSSGHVNEHRLDGAMGSGYKWAVSAMRLGLTPSEAVKFAIQNCVTCGGKIDTFEMPARRSRR